MTRSAFLLLALSGWVVAVGCRPWSTSPIPLPEPGFETGTASLVSQGDTLLLSVEIAETPQQHRIGLTERPAVPEDAGMLFLFEAEQPAGSNFWMYRTLLPLSIAFLDSAGVIREILDMEPCRSRLSIFCPRYRATEPFHAALEVNRGYFDRHGIGVGDQVTLTRDR